MKIFENCRPASRFLVVGVPPGLPKRTIVSLIARGVGSGIQKWFPCIEGVEVDSRIAKSGENKPDFDRSSFVEGQTMGFGGVLVNTIESGNASTAVSKVAE